MARGCRRQKALQTQVLTGRQERCVQNIDSFTTISTISTDLRNRRAAGHPLAVAGHLYTLPVNNTGLNLHFLELKMIIAWFYIYLLEV